MIASFAGDWWPPPSSLGMTVVCGAGVFVAAERDDRQVWADHRARLELELVPLTTAPIVAQVSRSPQLARLRRILRGCDVVAFRLTDR